MNSIQDFISSAASQIGAPESDVQSATSSLLGVIKDQADSGDASALLSKIPGAEALLSLNITGDDLRDAAELFLGIVGLVPGVGMIADGLSVGIAAARGNYGSALLSAAAFIPAIGMAAGGAKIAKIGARLGPKVVRAVKAIAKKSVGKLTKVFKRGAKRVLVDSNAIGALRKDPTLGGRLRPGEQPVVSFVSRPELSPRA
jgi:hypothetical protein